MFVKLIFSNMVGRQFSLSAKIFEQIHLGRIIVLLFGANNRIIRLLRWGGLLRIVLIPRLLFLYMPFHRVHEAEE